MSEIRAELDNLSPLLREVLVLRLGLNGDAPRKLEEVASILSINYQTAISRERVRQAEQRSLSQICKNVLKRLLDLEVKEIIVVR